MAIAFDTKGALWTPAQVGGFDADETPDDDY